MLRDTSTSTGTTASRDAVGGSTMHRAEQEQDDRGEHDCARSATSVTALAARQRSEGTAILENAAAPMAAASASASHQGSGYAKCIECDRYGFFFPAIDLSYESTWLRYSGGALSSAPAARRSRACLACSFFEIEDSAFSSAAVSLTLHLLPAGEVLFERFGARRGHRHPASLRT